MGSQVVWTNLGPCPTGNSTNLTLTVTAPASGTLTNIVSSASTTGDSDPSNNDGTAAAAKVVTTVYTPPVLTGKRSTNGFQLTFSTVPNTTVNIEASTNLLNWELLVTTNSGTGPVIIFDQNSGLYKKRFYRSSQ